MREGKGDAANPVRHDYRTRGVWRGEDGREVGMDDGWVCVGMSQR